MYLIPEHLKMLEYCKANGRGLLTPFELRFVDDINREREVFASRNRELSPGQLRVADQIVEKLQNTGTSYTRWQFTQAQDYRAL